MNESGHHYSSLIGYDNTFNHICIFLYWVREFSFCQYSRAKCQLNFLIHLVATCFVLMDGWMTKQTTNRIYVGRLCSLNLILVTRLCRDNACLYRQQRYPSWIHSTSRDIPERLETSFYAPDGENHCIQLSVTSSLRCGAIWTSLTG